MNEKTNKYACKKSDCPSKAPDGTPKAFGSNSDLQRHLEEIHGKKELFCSVDSCKRHREKPFHRESNLENHFKKTHPSLVYNHRTAELRMGGRPDEESLNGFLLASSRPARISEDSPNLGITIMSPLGSGNSLASEVPPCVLSLGEEPVNDFTSSLKHLMLARKYLARFRNQIPKGKDIVGRPGNSSVEEMGGSISDIGLENKTKRDLESMMKQYSDLGNTIMAMVIEDGIQHIDKAMQGFEGLGKKGLIGRE